MPSLSSQSISAIINSTVDRVAGHVIERFDRELAAISRQARASALRRPMRAQRRRLKPEEIIEWRADRNARRVPRFVIEATGLDTKKKIVAKFGENATFLRGKPLPKPRK